MSDRSEIGPAVIGLITIAVVDLVVRPLIGHPKMGKLAGGVATSLDPDVDPIFSHRASDVASLDPASLFQPGEHASIRVIVEQFRAAVGPPVWDVSSATPQG